MASARDLLKIYKKIITRVTDGVNNFDTVCRIINKRAEVEDRIVELFRGIVPIQFDESDPIEVSLIELIKSELNQHLTLAQKLRQEIINPSRTYEKTMKESKIKLDKNLTNQMREVEKACNAVDQAEQKLNSEKINLATCQPNKKESQEKTVNKCTQILREKKVLAEQVANKHQGQSVTTIHEEFGNFDKSRLNQMQKNGLEFAKHCLDFYIEGNKLVKQFGMKMQKFDANDRSQRFLRGAFDPTPKAENFEEQDVFAYAIADFRSEEPLDLQFLRGDKIKVLLQHTSGWWEGDLNGNKGYFPRSFVQVAGAVEVKNEPIGAVFLCVHDQKGSRSGELALLDGDLVLVDFIVKDKCTGTNLRTSLRGTFPLSLLDSRMT